MRGNGLALECEILDYCRGGLYLALARPVAEEVLSSLVPSTGVDVEFSHEGRAHRVRAQVARALPIGLGLQVAALPDDVMAALRAAVGPEPRIGGGEEVAPQTRRRLGLACHESFATEMNRVLRTFFDTVPQTLVQASHDAVGVVLRARFAQAAAQIGAERGAIAERFAAALRRTLHDPFSVRGAERSEVAPSELALVDDELFEDWLSVSTVVHQTEAELGRALVDLQRRYGALRELPLDRVTNPFGPTAICRAFQDAIAPLELPAPVRAVAFRTFGAAMRAACPDLYATLNGVLEPIEPPDAAALPGASAPADGSPRRAVVPVGRSPAGPGRAGAPAASSGGPAAAGESHGSSTAVATAPQPAPGTDPAASVTPVPATVDYSLARLMSALVGEALAPAQALDAVPAQERAAAAGGSAVVPDGLLGLIERLARRSPKGGGAAMPVAAVPTEAIEALDGVLDALPTASSVVAGGAAFVPTLSARLVGALDTVALPAPQRRSIESAAGLIGRALEQPGVDAEIQELLRRLERPLLKLAMRDVGFLNSARHPARRMVDLLEQYAIATDERGRFFDEALRQYLFRLVECVAERADREPAIFERACETLARLLVPIQETRRARVARIQQGCEARERIRVARERVARALDAVLAGRSVPVPVLGLLDAGWRQHLVLLETAGADAQRDEALGAIERLNAWLGPDACPGADFRAEWTPLLGRVEASLAEVCVDAAEREACIDALAGALAAVERGAGAPEAVLQPPAAETDAASRPAGLQAWVQRLRIGDWWLLPLPAGDTAMQLVWKSRGDGACAFASRSAGDRHELPLAEFARQLERGAARACPDPNQPLLERSEEALLDEGWRALVGRALVDPISGLPNRKGFVQQLARMARSPDRGARAHVIGIVEFDTLRMVWNGCGVEAGEALVRQLADVARVRLGRDAVIGSLRDDTFALLLPDADASEAASTGAVEALRACLAEHRFEHDGQRFGIGVGIGLARWVPAESDVEEALRRADAACVAARALGRHRVQVYEHASRELRSQESLSDWLGRIDGMLEGSGLYLRAQRVQPIGAADDLRPYYEILLGIEPMPGMETAPLGFVHAVERLGRSTDLDFWVVRAVLDWIDANRETFDRIGGFAINLSPLSLGSPELLSFLDERLARPGVPTEKLTFELTETAAIDSYGAAQEFIQRIRRHGCKVSLDDFGSGYASYGHLKHLRADSLKIDGAFVRDMLDSPSDRAMVKSMHEVARSLGIRTVAEHVETLELLEALREMGIDYGQGYAIHKPCRIEQLVAS